MIKTKTNQAKRCLTTFMAVLMLISLIPMATVSANTASVSYAEDFSTLTNAQITSGSTVTMANGATLKFSNNDSTGNHALTVEDGVLKATSYENKKGWTVTYTLPEVVYGTVTVDVDFRMGDFDSTGAVVSMQNSGNCYSGNRILVNDESGNKMSAWSFNKIGYAYINNRDSAQACATCGVAMNKFKDASTATVNHKSMTTLRAILDTDADTVKGGYVDEDGVYQHNQNQFEHNQGHDVVLPQATENCGGVKSITFQLFPDNTLGEYGSCMWLDNILVTNGEVPVKYTTRFYEEGFADVDATDITNGSTITMENGATLKFANSNTSGTAELTVADGALRATTDTDDKGWTVTYTLPKKVFGKVTVDFDFRMGLVSNGEEVALSSNSHYSNNRFLIYDENGKNMSAWGFNRTANAFINNRDNAQACATCGETMPKSSQNATATFAHDTMTTLRAILDTDADTVEGGYVDADGAYVHNKSQFGHTGDHNVVLPQLNTGCGGVKSITFKLFPQDDAVSPGVSFMYLDNITVFNEDETIEEPEEPEEPEIKTFNFREDFRTISDAEIVSGNTYTTANGAKLTFTNTDANGATLTIVDGALKATASTKNAGWTVTYTLPETVCGKVNVDFDLRMGSISDGAEVAFTGGNGHYSNKRFLIKDETGKEMSNWGFNKTSLAYINSRDTQSTCVTCNTQMPKSSGNPTSYFSHNSMTKLRAILDTDNRTVEGGYVDADGIYQHNKAQLDHTGDHDAVFKQVTDGCGGVRSITFQLFTQDGSGGDETFMYLDNISVSNAEDAVEYPARFYKESFAGVTAADIANGNTVTMSNGATLKFANSNTSGTAELAVTDGALRATTDTDDKGWTVTYTLPKTVHGKVSVDFDFRMGIISDGQEVALTQGGHYSNNRILIYDENGTNMSAWGFNRMANAFINNRDNAQACAVCGVAMAKSSWAPTATFSHDTMTTLRSILDTDADTVEGGAVVEGVYTHLQSQFGHNAGHDVVLPQLNADCGGVKSITFKLFPQDDAYSEATTTFMYLDNIIVTNLTADSTSELFVADCKVTDGYGTKVTTISANKNICVDATYVNAGSSAMTDTILCIALYDADDRMITIGAAEEDIAVGEVKPMSLTFKTPADLASGAYIKVFAWKSFDTLSPLEGAIIIGK